MHQVPTPIWNEIAATQHLKHPVWAKLFAMKDEAMTEAMNRIEDDLSLRGIDNRTILAWRLTAPLLQENEAISRYVMMARRPDLRSTLPELTTVNEAVILASSEYRLTPSQQARLSKLLQQSPKMPQSETPSERPTK